MELVYVRWLDARGLGGPLSLAAAKRERSLMMHSAGLLVAEDDQCIVIAQDQWSCTEDGDQAERVRDVEVIPRVLVQDMQRFTIQEGHEKLLGVRDGTIEDVCQRQTWWRREEALVG